ncbi:unnamed protein product [Absidia cylindrospora]
MSYSRRDRRDVGARLYIGKINRYVRERDLKSLFSRYGHIKDLAFLDSYAFVEFDDARGKPTNRILSMNLIPQLCLTNYYFSNDL